MQHFQLYVGHMPECVQILFTVPVTLTMHDFWNEDDADKYEIEVVQFMKVPSHCPLQPVTVVMRLRSTCT